MLNKDQHEVKTKHLWKLIPQVLLGFKFCEMK